MKKIIGILILVIFVFGFSCEETGFFIKCAECYENEPVDVDLEIKLDDFAGQSLINVYEGNLEDSILYLTLTSMDYIKVINVTLNKEYTITATYQTASGTYIAVDSARPRVRYDEEQCDNPCYYVYDNSVNLRLKYLD